MEERSEQPVVGATDATGIITAVFGVGVATGVRDATVTTLVARDRLLSLVTLLQTTAVQWFQR